MKCPLGLIHTHAVRHPYRLCIPIWKNNTNQRRHVLKKPLFRSFGAMHMYTCLCISLSLKYIRQKNENKRGWGTQQYDPAPGVEGSDHIYQVHSQFCSGFSSISLSLCLPCLRTHTCSQPLTTRHASVIC